MLWLHKMSVASSLNGINAYLVITYILACTSSAPPHYFLVFMPISTLKIHGHNGTKGWNLNRLKIASMKPASEQKKILSSRHIQHNINAVLNWILKT